MDARLELATRLAVPLKRHGLERHLRHLRNYYAAVRDGGRAEWDDCHVEHLARVFQVEPNGPLEVRPAGVGCCPGFNARTLLCVADRYVCACAGCERTWLVVMPDAETIEPPPAALNPS
jgi:hypothetical protein